MWATQFAQMQFVAEKNGWTKFISMQNHYSLLYREEEREMNRFCNDTGVGLIPVSSLPTPRCPGVGVVLMKCSGHHSSVVILLALSRTWGRRPDQHQKRTRVSPKPMMVSSREFKNLLKRRAGR
jgi:hypothetical protein